MRGMVAARFDDPVANLLGWWELAGLCTPVEDKAVNWLPAPAQTQLANAKAMEAKPSGANDMPHSLAEFLVWRKTSADVPEAAWPGARIVPGPAIDNSIMVITDLPDGEDMTAGMLLSGETGRLFDRMLRAIGLSRDAVYLCSLATTRPPGGMLSGADVQRLAEIMRRQIVLAAPRSILLLGDKTSRALLTSDSAETRGKLQFLNHEHGSIRAIATFHPRLLMRQAAAKAECWRDLQLFAKEVCT